MQKILIPLFFSIILVSIGWFAYAEAGFNIAAVGDIGCDIEGNQYRMHVKDTMNNIKNSSPELFLTLGDLSYEPEPQCFIEQTNKSNIGTNKTIITIGNHDDEEKYSNQLRDEYLQSFKQHNPMSSPYYSFDYKNGHFLVLYTQGDEENPIREAMKIHNKNSNQCIVA